MSKVCHAAALAMLLPLLAGAVNMRRASGNALHADATQANKSVIDDSAFSPDFIAAVKSALDAPQHKSASQIQVAAGGVFMNLAVRGAAELDAGRALAAISPPESVVKMLRHGHKMAAGANMWKADTDIQIVEKAIVNLNGMVMGAQKRLDAKNDECEEWKAKYTETLDQITSDLARLGEELSNTARAISVHMGGIEANILNNQMTKEEFAREELAYNEVRNADLIVLQERNTNLAVSAFILVFSACPDAPSASSLIQGRSNLTHKNMLVSMNVQTCVNSSTNGTQVRFEDARLDKEAARLSDEAQDMLLRFISTEQSMKGVRGRRVAEAATKLEPMALATMEMIAEDLDDGTAEDAGNDDEEDTEDENKVYQVDDNPSFLQQDPCGPPVERQEIPKNKPCSKVPASCCSCNKWFTSVKKHGDDENGRCFFVPSRRKCQAGKWLKRHKNVKAELVCGLKKPEEPVEKPPKSELKAANRCSNAKFDCGVLHDMFAALWGETKDLVDELVFKMNQDTQAFDKVKLDINTLLQTQATQLSNLQAALAEASADKAAQTDEQAAKQKEKTDTTKLFEATMKECSDVMKEILFTEVCGVLAVRNNMIAAHMPGEPTPTDCSVGEWVASDCSVSCDDEMQGGVHVLSREVMVVNTPKGVACPLLSTTRKCKQIPCPIDCALSHWSPWNKCSKECGGGVQSQTRSSEMKPKNGGKACDAKMQTQPCNTGSCDVDCVLGKWMDWKPCTKACNAGYEERRKRMVSDAKGDGFCLDWNAKERLERKPCNTQACTGDEACNSTIDLVIAIDSSGSVTETGFDILKEFAKKIVQRLMAAVQVAVVLFGNGKLDLETNVISDAKVITDNLEPDMASVEGKIDGMIIHKGFTNMAQAFSKSKDVLTYARKQAQAVVLVITDGRPSFKFQTGFAVKSLRKSARLMIVQVQANRKQEIAELLKGYVSEPWNVNYRHIAGKKKLAGAYDSYVTSQLADLCPRLVSPSALAECTVADGSGASDVYPCECGKALCKQGEFCKSDEEYCVPPELAFVQGKKKRVHHK